MRTPILILVFGINPGTAVSSDLLTSVIMRPGGGAVHVRRGTVAWKLVGWLCLGSVPAGFSGVLVLRAIGNGHEVQHDVQLAIAWALVTAVVSLLVKALIGASRAGAAADALGGEERLEQVGLDFRTHADTVVADRQHDVISGFHHAVAKI